MWSPLVVCLAVGLAAAEYAWKPGTEYKEMQRRAASAPSFRKTVIPYEVISEEDYSTGHRSRYDSRYNSTSRKTPSSTGCTQFRIKIIEEDSRTCFSMRPLPICGSKCRPAGKIKHKVPVHCVADSEVSRHYVQMVNEGVSPDFNPKEVTKYVTISLPMSCTQE